MNKAEIANHHLNEMDVLANKDTPIHQLSALSKLIVTIVYILFVMSFPKYSFSYVDDGVEKEEVYLTAAYPDESEYFCVFFPGPQVQMADSLAGELFQNVRESTDEEMTVSENAAVSENVIEEE